MGQCVTAALPTQLEAEDYCGFNETTPGTNSGAGSSPACDRGDGVDIQTTADDHGPGNCNIGWTSAGEYLDYQLNSPGGQFDIILRAASSTGMTGRELAVALDGTAVGSVTFDGTGWQSFTDLTLAGVTMSAGIHDLRVTFVNGATNLNHLEFSASGGGGSALIDADFSTGAAGFSYADDTFRSTANPAYAAGSATGGALQVVVGGVNGADITNGMSGGWSGTFTAPTAMTVDISFDYTVTFPCNYEPDETGQILFALDGALLGSGANTSLIDRDGGSNCNNAPIRQSYQGSAAVTAGVHTITLGAYNNKKTTATEQLTATFDNVRVTGAPQAASCTDGLQNQDETDIDCGGATCGACADGLTCIVGGDCVSGQCTGGVCQTAAPCANGTLPAKIEAEAYCAFFESDPGDQLWRVELSRLRPR